MSATTSRKVVTCSHCLTQGHTKASSKCPLKGKDPAPRPEKAVRSGTRSKKKTSSRTKAKAGANEKEDIRLIVAAIHDKTPVGLKLIEAFRKQFGIELLDARERKGNRGVHYDFQILIGPPPGIWKTSEHKGGRDKIPIKLTDSPWSAGVQFHNGGCELYTIAKKWVRLWYDTHIGSGALKAEWGLVAPIPSFDEWFAKDAKVQGNPKTAFGKELKQKVRAAGARLLDKRGPVNAAFNPTEDDMNTLKAEILPIMNSVLGQKDYWLTIRGSLTSPDDFNCAWYPQFLIGEIEEITMKKEKDIWFDFKCSDTSFKTILRSGKALFSNFRMDARD